MGTTRSLLPGRKVPAVELVWFVSGGGTGIGIEIRLPEVATGEGLLGEVGGVGVDAVVGLTVGLAGETDG